MPRYVGRAAERDRLSSVLGQLRAGLSAVLVLSGEAGIGKTYLLRWLAENAAGIRTVLVSAYEAEVGLGFAALHRLLLPLLSDPAELPDPQRDALGTAFGLVSGPAPSRFLVGPDGPAGRPAAAGALPGPGPRPVHRESQDHISVCEVTAAPAG